MSIPANIILENSYVLGWKFSNFSFHLLGEFRNTDLEPDVPPKLQDDFYFKWQLGELVFKDVKSAKFSEQNVMQGKDGELDLGPPDISFAEDRIRIEFGTGYCELIGDKITIDYIS